MAAVLGLTWLLAAPVRAQGEAAEGPVTLVCFDIAAILDACEAGAAAWSAETGHPSRVVAASYGGRTTLDQYSSLLTIRSGRIDVLQIPEDWLPSLANQLQPLAAPVEVDRSALADQDLPNALITLAQREDGLIALPHAVELQLLYYRTDVLEEAPETWAALRAALTARTRALGAEDDQLRGLLFAGQSDRLLTDVILTFLLSFGAPPLIDAEGNEAITRPAALNALAAFEQLLGGVIPLETAALSGDAMLAIFADGGAAAMLASSIYHDRLVEEAVVGPFTGVATPPAGAGEGGKRPALATAFYLGVSRFSDARDAAQSLARFLASPEWQEQAAVEFGLAPAMTALYGTEAVLAARPWFADIAAALAHARTAPVAAFSEAWIPATELVAGAARRLMAGEIDPSDLAGTIAPSLRLMEVSASNRSR